VRVEVPGFAAIDHGGDGLAIHRVAPDQLMFRLWEIKKNTGGSSVSSTVNTAYSQLNSRATEYLARYTSIGQEMRDNPELAEFYGKLPELWIEAEPSAAVGVSVAINMENVPATAFTTFGTQFPRFVDPRRLKGMLTAIEDFASFSAKVQEAIWRGL